MAGNACTVIPGAAGLSYTLKLSDAGHTIRLLETASNSAGAGQPASSAQTAVVTAAPANISASVLTGKTIAGNTLSGSTGVWTGTLPITYLDQWQRCGSACANVTGATHSTYKLQSADVW